MKFYYLIFILAIIISCNKEKNGKQLPNGYYDCTFTFDSSGDKKTGFIEKDETNDPSIISFNNGNTLLEVDKNKNILPSALLVFNGVYSVTGYWYFDKENKIYYIKGTFDDPYQANSTGTFVISKELE